MNLELIDEKDLIEIVLKGIEKDQIEIDRRKIELIDRNVINLIELNADMKEGAVEKEVVEIIVMMKMMYTNEGDLNVK